MQQCDRRRRDIEQLEVLRERLHQGAHVVEVAGHHALLNGGARCVEPLRLERRKRGQRRDLDFQLRERFDVAQQALLARLDERDRHTLAADASRPADPVDVHLGRSGDVVVDDVRDVLDVEPAGSDVGRDQHIGPLRAKQRHHAVALFLLHAAVQGLGAVAVRLERVRQLVHLDPRAAEDDCGGRGLELENPSERGALVGSRDDVGRLADLGQLAGRPLFGLDVDPHRFLQVPSGDRCDARRHGRGEQRRLPRLGGRREDRLEVFGEAHVEHLVGFVEHEHLERVEIQRTAPQVIERATRRRNDDVRASPQGANLLIHRRSAVTRDDGQLRFLAVLVDRLGDLHRKFARGNEDQRPRAERLALAHGARQPVQERKRERRGLPRSRAGLRDDVAAGEEDGDRLALDRRRLFVPEAGDRVDERSGETERGETDGSLGGNLCHEAMVSAGDKRVQV